MIKYLRITFDSRWRDSGFLRYALISYSKKLRYFGYVLGKDLTVVRGDNPRQVVLTGYFTGRDAWEKSWADSRNYIEFDRCEARRLARGEPIVEELKRPYGEPVPWCKCPTRTRPALDLWCTPYSMCPPLMCSKGGVIEFYKLPLSHEGIDALWNWNEAVCALAVLRGLNGEKGPYLGWAKKQLSNKTSDMSRESVRVARLVSKETGRKVIAVAPPIHPMRL